MSPSQAVAYQATDLARNHREVIDAAREHGALIRDKDGVALLMAPAADFERNDEIAELGLELVRVARVVIENDTSASASRYGRFGWLSVLPLESRVAFFSEMSEALFLAASGLSLRPVELLLGDWKATAESWADPETRERLLAGAPEPLGDLV